jgi:hypothetical protein
MKSCPNCLDNHDKNGVYCSRSCANKWEIKNLEARVCVIPNCSQQFTPGSRGAKYCSASHDKQCIECHNMFRVRSRDWDGHDLCYLCSRLASAVKGRETMMGRYGVDNPMKLDSTKEKSIRTSRNKYGVSHFTQTKEYRRKVKESNLSSYGVEHTFQRDDVKDRIIETNQKRYGANYALQNGQIKEKAKRTNLERYGVENVAQAESVKSKIRETNLTRYGVISTLQNPEVQEKRRATWDKKWGGHPLNNSKHRESIQEAMMEKHGVSSPFSSKEIRAKARDTMVERYGVEYPLQDPAFHSKQLKTFESKIAKGDIQTTRISKKNRQWAKKITERFGVEVSFEKTVDRSAFDLYIESENLLIEVNPTISHNSEIPFQCNFSQCEQPCSKHTILPNSYHYRRALLAQANGYSLIQIYDWDDEEKTLRFLASKLERGWKRHSARKLKLTKITSKDANKFLNQEHWQGGVRSQIHCYGLVDNETLLAVATFGKSRFGSDAEWEWLRYSVKRGNIIHGGANRLLQEFTTKVTPHKIISYVDFDHTTAQKVFLESCDFHQQSLSGPSLVWSKKDKRIYNNSLIRLGADRLLGTSYGKRAECGLNNKEIMLLEGWLPVYTSGNRIFCWHQ